MKTSKAEISISRDSNDTIRIEIEDGSSNIRFVELKMSMENFAHAITGLYGVHCEATYKQLENVGKQRVTEERQAIYPDSCYCKDTIRKWLMENCQEEGFIINSYLGSKNSIVPQNDKTIVNYSVTKFI